MLHDHTSNRWHSHEANIFPFTAIIGQELMKKALILNTINPSIGGVLIKGEKGTAKSTAARALTELLPHIKVVKGCSFHCDPDPDKFEELCTECRKKVKNGEKLLVEEQHMKFVTLPVSATEDRVVGTIDLNKALKHGEKVLEPGILAEVNRGILYIDEVNLLDNHVADLLLDAAAMGYNIIEREGISFFHPAKFILVGTMNPEEGDLRPQLLDRFGLTVEVRGETDVDKRIAIIKAREEFEKDKESFKHRQEAEQRRLANQILSAKNILHKVKLSEDLLRFISLVCIKLGTDGHRADITIAKTAKTIAAFQNRNQVIYDDLKEAMILALPHRLRKGPFRNKKFDPDEFNDFLNDLRKELGLSENESGQSSEDAVVDNGKNNEETPPSNDEQLQSAQEKKNEESKELSTEDTESIDDGLNSNGSCEEGEEIEVDDFEPIPLSELTNEQIDEVFNKHQDKYNFDVLDEKQKVYEIGEGLSESARQKLLQTNIKNIIQHSKSRKNRFNLKNTSGSYNGRYRSLNKGEKPKDLAVDATLKASAIDSGANGGNLDIKHHHLRLKIRKSPMNILIIFVLDSSGSMAANKRMSAAKGAIYSLMQEIYIRKDKLCLISFSGDKANLILPPTNSVDVASELLEEIPTGGKTPLSAGLHKAIQIAATEFNTRGLIPLVVLLSDGKQNVHLYESFEEDKDRLNQLFEQNNIPLICIDTDMSRFNLGFAKDLARKFNAVYYELDKLRADNVANIISDEYKHMTKVLDSA